MFVFCQENSIFIREESDKSQEILKSDICGYHETL